jgi:hypothetical protein
MERLTDAYTAAMSSASGPDLKVGSTGAFIPRDGQAATDFAAGMQPETRARLSALARHVLAA